MESNTADVGGTDQAREAPTCDYVFVELGEGRQGEYDPTDPDDVELLRLDYCEDGEEVESACTNLPASSTASQQTQALSLVSAFAAAHPDVTPRKVIEIFSWMDETWLEEGNSAAEGLFRAMMPDQTAGSGGVK